MSRSWCRRIAVLFFFAVLIGCGTAVSSPEPAGQKKQDTKDRAGPPEPHVVLVRTPDGGIQPQAVMKKGVLHLVYFKGDPKHGDLYYVHSKDNGKNFSKAMPVNSHPQSAIAVGNIRGAHLAVSDNGRAHVAWMGSMKAEPKAPGKETPMLYARLNDEGTAFEQERNLIQVGVGLDGGGSLAADGRNVYVFWHAPAPETKGEEHRRVWFTASSDEGKSFGKERMVSPPETGVCGCCGMRAFASPGVPGALYRSAKNGVHRDSYVLFLDFSKATDFKAVKVHNWQIAACPMSSFAFADTHSESLLAWETDGQVWFTRAKHLSFETAKPIAAPGKGQKQKHPVLAWNGREHLLAWTEGMGWNKGGALAWQVYDNNDRPMDADAQRKTNGRAEGVPTWSLISAVPSNDQRFLILY
ncbi:MAG: hypothetical protein L0Y72_16490 [Gemmataceae bacterium]|nr:hypothetical protein [Gemmataceae bacterium]MCI0740648.1 hypothetical protein [Gemmataceae bacterium]